MKITVRCPNKDCGQTYSVDSSKIGSEANCKRCGRSFQLAAETIDDTSTEETHPTPVQSTEPAKRKPQKLGRFEIRQRVGSGAFGDVCRAHDPALERDIALKVPRSGVVMSEQAKARFLREPKAAAQLQHPHIVPVFETGAAGKHLYIASAFIEGETLDGKIGGTDLDFRQAAQIVHDLADALHSAHQRGIVHRDVKSSNVMIDSSGQETLTPAQMEAKYGWKYDPAKAVIEWPGEAVNTHTGKTNPRSERHRTEQRVPPATRALWGTIQKPHPTGSRPWLRDDACCAG